MGRIKILLVAGIILWITFRIASPQEVKHAPALEACVADANLWVSEVENGLNQGRIPPQLTWKQLVARQSYLMDCQQAYPKHQWSNDLNYVYEMEQAEREMKFIVRHKLFDQFIKEDEAGER